MDYNGKYPPSISKCSVFMGINCMIYVVYTFIPWLLWSHLTLCCTEAIFPQTQYITANMQICVLMLKMSSSYWTTMIMGSLLNHAVGFGSKAALKKLRNLCLNLGRGLWQFHSWLRSLGSLKLASQSLRALIRMSSEQRKLQDACLL